MKEKATSMQNILRKILEKDQEGQETVQQAEEEARQIIEEADKHKQEAIDQARKEAQEEAKEIVEKARHSVDDQPSQENVEVAGITVNKEQFERNARQNMGKAVDVLVRFVQGEEDIS